MSLLESYRKFYQATAERRERHHFKWTMKKTEEEAEESIYSGGIMSMGGAVQGEATRFLAEGIEEWLNPPKIPEVRTYGRWFWTRPGYGL